MSSGKGYLTSSETGLPFVMIVMLVRSNEFTREVNFKVGVSLKSPMIPKTGKAQ